MNSKIYQNEIIGNLRITEENNIVTAIEFADGEYSPDEICSDLPENAEAGSGVLDRAYAQIEEYLRGCREEFTFPVQIAGTEFQKEVWSALLTIPYGETRSYGEIAEMIGKPRATRAVGMANNANRLPIVIPCHRVIGKDGRLTGYGGGIDRKKLLLEIERKGVAEGTALGAGGN